MGQLQQIGTPQQVYAKPETVFVATFIGTPPMNVMPAGLFERSEVLVGVRPEHLQLSSNGGLPLTVRMVEQLGHETLLICDAVGTRVVVRQDAEAAGAVDRRRDQGRCLGSSSSPLRSGHRAQDRRMKKKWRELPIAVGMLAPSAVILGVFVVYPLVRAIQLGHLRCDATGKRCREGGWGQYIDVFRSNEFQHALANTARLALMTVPIGLALGIGLAVLADKQIRGIGFFRTVFSSTVATSVAVASLVWFVLLQPEVGVLPDLLPRDHPVAEAARVCCATPAPRCPPSRSAASGPASGSRSSSSLRRCKGFPRELYESAFVDGAGGWMRFSNVTMPMLGPTILFTSVVLTTRAFQAYAEIALLTGGGPDPQRPTQTVPYLIYGQNSLVKNDIGLKSAAAVLLFFVLLVLAFVQFRGLDKRVHYGS